MIDISIKQLKSKYSNDNILDFLTKHNKIEAKLDGVKLTIVKIADNGNLDDWLVSYKGQLFYRGEFDYQDLAGKKITAGSSQFDVVFDHLESLGKTNIKVNTEFFCEFLIKKYSLMSNYKALGNIILIGYGKANPEVKFGKIKTNSESFETKNREKLARELQVLVPPVLIDGVLYPVKELKKSVKDDKVLKLLQSNFPMLATLESAPVDYFNFLSGLLLEVESKFGGKEEGVVISNSDGIFKLQQDYQLDKEKRKEKKLQYQEDDPQTENAYWKNVLDIAETLAKEAIEKTQDIKTGLSLISDKLTKIEPPKHQKKNPPTVLDDIQENAKKFFLKLLPDNDGALVIGKFRVLTTGHAKMIERAVQESDEVVVGVVTGSRTKNSKDLRLEAIRKAYPYVKVIELTSGNLFTAFKNADININKIYAGSDRVDEYKKMLAKAPGINVNEIQRSGADISATKVIENIHDVEFFKANTPKTVHRFYKEYLKLYG